MEKINDILSDNFIGKEASIRGWVYRIRSSGKITFIVLRDSSNIIQCIASSEKLDENSMKELSSLTVESSIEINGIIHREDRAVTGYELLILSYKIIG